MEALDKTFSVDYPGAKYIKKTRRGWDGKKHFITENKVLTGLVPRVIQTLKKVDIEPIIVDYSTKVNLEFINENLGKYSLFDDQISLLQKICNQKRGIVKASTGAGKTLILAYILKLLNPKKALIITNKKQLVKQLYEFLTKECKFQNIGICFGEGFIRNDIMVCSTGSIEKILDTHLECDALLVDEIHEFSGGKKSMFFLENIEAPIKLGFTATVPEDKFVRYNIEGIFGSIIEGETTSKLTEKKRISKANVKIIKFDIEEVKSYNSENYNYIYENVVINGKERNLLISRLVESIFELNKKAKILILVKNIDHLNNLLKLIPNSISIQGSDDISSRYNKISKFLNSSSVLIGTNVLQTGVNIKEITDFINARGLKDEIPTIQALGRALRITEFKSEVNIYDIKDNCKYLKDHSLERISHYKKEGHEINEITI